MITYGKCPLIWARKLQTEIALSTTEAEYIALSQSMQEIIPLLGLLKEINEFFTVINCQPNLCCTIFEDNKSCIQLAKAPRMNPCTKYIALKYHHFRSYVASRLVQIEHVDTNEQIADIFTKGLDEGKFNYLRR